MKLFKKAMSFIAVLALVLVALPLNAGAAKTVIDFEDGKFDGISVLLNDDGDIDGDPSKLSVVDFNGSKALKVENVEHADISKISFNVAALVGADNVSKVRGIEIDLTIQSQTGGAPEWHGGIFGANFGEGAETWDNGPQWDLGGYGDEDITETLTINRPLGDDQYFVDGTAARFLFQDWGSKESNYYFDNVKFFDADGNYIELLDQADGDDVVDNNDADDADDVDDVEDTTTDTEKAETNVPKTGENNTAIYIAIASLAIVASAILLNKKKNQINA